MANDNRIQQMQQQFNELREAIASDIAARFEASELRLREGLSRDLDDKFAVSERRLTENLTRVIVQQLETAQRHLEGRLQVHMEDLKGVVTTTAEAYGGTLDRIERDLGDLKQEMVTKYSDHDKELSNHGQRLATLERARRGSRR
jgi:hypothetical protein